MSNDSLPPEMKSMEVKLLDIRHNQFQVLLKHKNAAMQAINASISTAFRDMLNNTANHSTSLPPPWNQEVAVNCSSSSD